MIFGALFLSIHAAPPDPDPKDERGSDTSPSTPPTQSRPTRSTTSPTRGGGAPTGMPSPPPPEQPTTAPWSVLTGKKLHVKTTAGLTAEGILLGVEEGNAILEDDDGNIVSIPTSDVESVRTIKVAPAEPVLPPALPSTPIPTEDLPDSISTTHTNEELLLQRMRIETMRRRARGSAIAGGVLSSVSAIASIVTEGLNIQRWALTSYRCDEDTDFYGNAYDSTECGWTDDNDSLYAMPGLTTSALVFHIMGGPITLSPTARLRKELGYRKKRGRQVAAWVLWGVGISSLVTDVSVTWTQFATSGYVCGPADDSDCFSTSQTRGVPPTFYLISAGLTLSSAILGIVDAMDVEQQAGEQGHTKVAKARPTMTVFPFRLQQGGGFGVAGRF